MNIMSVYELFIKIILEYGVYSRFSDEDNDNIWFTNDKGDKFWNLFIYFFISSEVQRDCSYWYQISSLKSTITRKREQFQFGYCVDVS